MVNRNPHYKNKTHNNYGTLDQKHNETVSKFGNEMSELPKKKLKLSQLKYELSTLKNLNKCTQTNMRKKTYIMDQIDFLEKEIKYIENREGELEYIDRTLPILIDYYDRNNTDDNESYDYSDPRYSVGIMAYFNNKSRNEKPNAVSNNRKSKATLHNDYLDITDVNYRNNNNKPKDDNCSIPGCTGKIILSYTDSHYVCNKCGIIDDVLMTTDKPNYKEPSQESGTYAYKRINHLTEILSQLQAKESTDIPHTVYDTIHRELRKRNIDRNDLDIFSLRKILKKLKYRKYYEHVPHILYVINQKKPPNFSRKTEMIIKQMFRDIQEPFAIYCPKNRKNFLNYSYILHKFCELLGLDEHIEYFPLLKNNAKLLQHEKIWKKICEHMRWKYYKSI